MKKFKKINSILYVEDEKNIREELAEFLENFCETLYLAENGLEGLSLFKEYSPDIIISDIKMPKMNGLEMANAIFELNKESHIIFTTAFNDQSFLHEAIEIHADGYIIKPIDLEKLESMLIKTIKIQNMRKELDLKTKYEMKKKAELETILATTIDGIAVLDLSLNFLYANSAYERMTGYSLTELKNKNVFDITILEQKSAIQEVLKKGYIDHFQNKCITKNGKKIIVDVSLAIMPENHRILIATKDITKEVSSQKKIEEYLEIIDENIITSSTDLEGRITYASKAFCNISGYSKDELIGQKHNIIKNMDNPVELYAELWDTIVKNQIWTGEVKNKNKKGGSYWVYMKIYPVFNEDGVKTGYTSIRHDITNLKKIEKMAIKDALTSVYNRHFFNQTIGKYIQNAKRNEELVCFAIFDIDYFKQYNDTYGHQEGDNALIKVANEIENNLHRADDYIFRLGGEEFGILFKSNSKEYAIEYCNQFIEIIQNLKIEHSKSSISKHLSISAGLVCEEASLIENETLLYKKADELLYKAKEQGRNQLAHNKKEI